MSLRQATVSLPSSGQFAPMEKLTIRLPPATLTSLRQRARKNGCTVSEEIRRASDTYLFGVSPSEYEMLETLMEKFRRAAKELERALNSVLHRIEHRKKALPAYPADDGPLSADQIKQIRSMAKLARPSKGKLGTARSSISSCPPRRSARSKRSGSG